MTKVLESFVYYNPKDIVSGDFYWSHQIKDSCFFCVADCTGHGVPGAFMSMLGTTMLDQIVKQENETNTGEILSKLNNRIIEKLNTNHDNKDGMDIIVCSINTKTLELNFSGAINSIFYLSNNKLSELKTDSAYIGDINYINYRFKVYNQQLCPGDSLYLSTDGYRDQKGGEKNTKYFKKRFKELLQNIHPLPVKEQKECLSKEFARWKGYNEQIDDVCVLGINIST